MALLENMAFKLENPYNECSVITVEQPNNLAYKQASLASTEND